MTMNQAINGIGQIMGRIREIEQRFVGSTNTIVDVAPFAPTLQKNMQQIDNQAQQTETGMAKSSAVLPLANTGRGAHVQNLISLGSSSSGGAANSDNNITSMVYQAAGKYGVDPKLALAVAKTESGLQPEAVSAAGAVGVMQLMPDTASSLGVKDIYNARDNIDGGVHYIKQMLNMFDGDVPKALAAYNAGPQAVKQYSGIPPYQETREYINRVMDLARQSQ